MSESQARPARKAAAAKPTPAQAPEDVAPEPLDGGVLPSQWEFLNRTPTREEVQALIETLPPVWGVDVAAYGEYMQALPQNKKVKRPHPDPTKNVTIVDSLPAYTLYMSVGGRQQMLREAQEKNGWRVDYRPEPVTPTGVPGYLSFKDRLVYRVYVDVYLLFETRGPGDRDLLPEPVLLGTRSGTAWVPESGGSNAAATNPYEKVETSALGRAIGAWGFGVLPGSGIATVEEMAAIAGNRAHMEASGGNGGKPQGERQSREELIESTLSTIEHYRQLVGKNDAEMAAQIGAYLVSKLGIARAWDPHSGTVVWAEVKDGQLVMLRKLMQEGITRLKDAEFGV